MEGEFFFTSPSLTVISLYLTSVFHSRQFFSLRPTLFTPILPPFHETRLYSYQSFWTRPLLLRYSTISFLGWMTLVRNPFSELYDLDKVVKFYFCWQCIIVLESTHWTLTIREGIWYPYINVMPIPFPLKFVPWRHRLWWNISSLKGGYRSGRSIYVHVVNFNSFTFRLRKDSLRFLRHRSST